MTFKAFSIDKDNFIVQQIINKTWHIQLTQLENADFDPKTLNDIFDFLLESTYISHPDWVTKTKKVFENGQNDQ